MRTPRSLHHEALAPEGLQGKPSCISKTLGHYTKALRLSGIDIAIEAIRSRGTVKLAESRLGKSRVGRVKGRDEDASRPDLRRPSLPR